MLRALAARHRAGSQPLARDDGLRIALIIEGGGMRGIISAGMALTLDELGLVPAFDTVYGASAGAITGAWLLSRPEGLRGWAEPAYAKTLIRRSALLRGRPVVDIRALIEDLYQTTFPMDFAAVLASPVELHPLATDAATGQSTDLRPVHRQPGRAAPGPASQRRPAPAGRPAGRVRRPPLLRRGRLGVRPLPHRPGPGRHPPADPPLPPRPAPSPDGSPPRSARLLARTTLRRETPALRATFLARESRRAADDQLLADYEAASAVTSVPATHPAVFSIRPAADSPAVSRLTTDGAVLRAALEAGRAAAHRALDACASDP